MAMTVDLSTHRSWEDWLTMALGVLIVVSPALAREGGDVQFAILNSIVVGLVIACLAALELYQLDAWEELVEGILGLWLIAAPWVLGYSHLRTLTTLHVVLGAIVALLAALELWQDRDALRTRA